LFLQECNEADGTTEEYEIPDGGNAGSLVTRICCAQVWYHVPDGEEASCDQVPQPKPVSI